MAVSTSCCWTSASRKSVLPIFEQLNGLLFYPVQYEGEESSHNIFYTGATPNQQAIPAVRYLMSKQGGDVRRFVLLGTDYVYPRTTNRILSAYLKDQGVPTEDIITIYTPFGHSDWQETIKRIKAFGSAGKKTAVISTINGAVPNPNFGSIQELNRDGEILFDLQISPNVFGGAAAMPYRADRFELYDPALYTVTVVPTPTSGVLAMIAVIQLAIMRRRG